MYIGLTETESITGTYSLSIRFFGSKEKEASHRISLLFWQCNKEPLSCPTEQTFSIHFVKIDLDILYKIGFIFENVF